MNKTLNLICPINGQGYGISAYNIWKHLRLNTDICLFPISQVEVESHWDKEGLVADIQDQLKYNSESPCLKIWHASDLVLKPHSRGRYCTYTFFEVDSITKSERIGYDISDSIITPTNWSKNILINNGINGDKVYVANPGVDTNIFDHKVEVSVEDKSEKYIFLNIGKWEVRKGHDVLVHMFNKAFEDNDDVELWMVNNNPFLSQKENKQWENIYKNSKLGDKIKIFPRLPSQKSIAKMIALSDCGIYPSRAEGWNNEGLETMAMNKPIILTDYSAHTDYANKDNSFLIDINKFEEAQDGIFFQGNGQWAKLDTAVIDQAAEHMRHVYKNQIVTNQAGLNTALELSWDNTASNIEKIIWKT
jgi:glycosyltransferase involved in cell wall biosynthesis